MEFFLNDPFNKMFSFFSKLHILPFRYYWLFGGAICLVVIMFCLFPLWPRVLRRGAHWLATGAVGFLIGKSRIFIELKYSLMLREYFLLELI